MSKLNDFEKVCKALNSNARASEDMGYVKLYLTNSIHGNKDKLLKLKAECKSGDFMAYASFMLSIGVIMFTMVSYLLDYLFNISPENYTITKVSGTVSNIIMQQSSNQEVIFYMIIFLIGTGVLIYTFKKLLKYTYINKWGNYISVYLEDIEKNWDEYFPKTGIIRRDDIMNPFSY